VEGLDRGEVACAYATVLAGIVGAWIYHSPHEAVPCCPASVAMLLVVSVTLHTLADMARLVMGLLRTKITIYQIQYTHPIYLSASSIEAEDVRL
jgi:hypothetical protein